MTSMHSSVQVGPLKPTNVTVNGTSCGSCYGAGAPGQCCNSCEEVRRADDAAYPVSAMACTLRLPRNICACNLG